MKRNKSKTRPVSSWCYQRQAGSMRALQPEVWLRVRGALGECGGAGKSGTLEDRKRVLSHSPSRRPMEEDALAGDWFRKKTKRKEKQPG